MLICEQDTYDKTFLLLMNDVLMDSSVISSHCFVLRLSWALGCCVQLLHFLMTISPIELMSGKGLKMLEV